MVFTRNFNNKNNNKFKHLHIKFTITTSYAIDRKSEQKKILKYLTLTCPSFTEKAKFPRGKNKGKKKIMLKKKRIDMFVKKFIVDVCMCMYLNICTYILHIVCVRA